MGKKHRRKKKYRRPGVTQTARRNHHHLLWRKSNFSKNKWSALLRSHPALIVEMNAKEHAIIHEKMDGIPVPPEWVCKQAYEEIEKLVQSGAMNAKTPIYARLSVLICILDYVATPTTEALKKELAIVQSLRGD